MTFPPGKPILALLALAAICGAAVVTRPPPPRADLLVWCFAASHAQTYRDPLPQPDGRTAPSLIEQFHRRTGLSVRVDLIGQMAEDVRLISLFMSHAPDAPAPDLCEIEIGSIGKFLRPPIDQIGLLPLNDLLARSGDEKRLLPSRLALWSKIDPRTGRRIYFGIPNDVHPVTLTYRKDLFDEAGIDLSSARTWQQLQSLCLQFQARHAGAGPMAMELPTASADVLALMLLQRNINLIDAADQLHLNDPRVAETTAFYAQLVAGPRAVGTDGSPGALWTNDLADGRLCVFCTPDWRVGDIARHAPQLTGKLRMMPLPRFEPSDAPTSTWGGTMMGIPRSCQHPEQAWALLQWLYLSPQGNAARLASGSAILPPEPALWADPAYHRPDPLFGGESVEGLYVELAPHIPERNVTPFTAEAEVTLGLVLRRAEQYARDRGFTGLTAACQGWLDEAQARLQQRIDFERF